MHLWVERLTSEYTEKKKELELCRERLDRTNEADQIDYTVIGGMIGDMDYAIRWMKTGRRPGNRRGIERQSIYQRTALLDPELFPSLDIEPQERVLDDDDRRMIADMLWNLSTRERQCYLLHMSYGMSYSEIAAELKVSRSSVQKFVERAREKVSKYRLAS